MKALIQRVKAARVEIDGKIKGEIEQGLVILLGIEQTDTQEIAERLLHKISNYRVFADGDDKMNLSVLDVKGGLLIVSQFTLVADTQKGLRPSFSKGANPIVGQALYNYFVGKAAMLDLPLGTGQFGADMQVHLINDGPVTFLLSA
jgi:D-tyrosyl-tRNA(Tyr) deacylase